MKSEKKLAKKKARKHVLKKRLMYGAIVIAVIALTFFIYSSSQKPSGKTDNFSFKAAIVDHLSKGGIVPWPNQTFIDNSRNTLEAADFTVSIYSYEELNVEFYRSIPSNEFSLMIFRVHSAIVDNSTLLGLFSSEPYDVSKLTDGPYSGYFQQYPKALVEAFYNASSPHYFAIAPDFVQYLMQGRFQNTIIILMGCDGLKFNSMAEAFVRKGAKVCIGWNASVDASRTDRATDYLLNCLVTRRYDVSNAVNETMQVIGPDPHYGSVLKYYPASAANYTIPSYTGLALNVTEITMFLIGETERVSLI